MDSRQVGGAADRISDLPDDLLHSVLLRLPSTADAARTSVLSRRWLRVWTGLPKLTFRYFHRHRPARGSQAPAPDDRIEAALAAYAASAPPTAVINRLEIAFFPGSLRRVTARYLSSWLRFASQRLAGELKILVPRHLEEDQEAVLLPLSERVTAIDLETVNRPLRFGFVGGAFTALTSLRINMASVDSRELDDVLSSRCPSLTELVLRSITLQDGALVFPIRSGTLQRLELATGKAFNNGLLRIATPELRTLRNWCISCDAYIAAPKILEVQWNTTFYDPSRHHFAEAGRHLRRLEVATESPTVALMRRFDTVHELNLSIFVSQRVQQYERLMENDLKELAKCEVLVVTFQIIEHYFMPVMIRLLQKCAGIRKLVVALSSTEYGFPCKSLGCPCNLPENHKTNRIVLDSLEEVEVTDDGSPDQKVELVRLLSKCSATSKKNVLITVYEGIQTRHTRMRLRSIIPPNNKVKIAIRSP